MSRKRSKHPRGNGSKPAPSPAPLPPCPSAPLPRVRWEGAFFNHHSLARVNRELCRALLASGRCELSLVPAEGLEYDPADDPRCRGLGERCFAPLSRPAVVEVRHQFPPRLGPAREGTLALVQPWEFGPPPRAWVAAIERERADVWCYSRFVLERYREAGVPEERLRRVPLGADPSVFLPAAPPYVFTTEPGAARLGAGRRFTFAYVGGTIWRKGADVLLEAYLRAFAACDDVLMVIKDTGTETVYRGQGLRERLRTLATDASRPAIVYLEEELSPHQLAGLYTAADCLVQPYRGEGFCLPALEAMACGIPVITTAGGATDDFVDETVGWRVAAERRSLGGEGVYGGVDVWTPERADAQRDRRGRVDGLECVGEPWVLEPDVAALAHLLRAVVPDPGEAQRRGAAGHERVLAGWTWEQSAEAVLARVGSIEPRRHGDTEFGRQTGRVKTAIGGGPAAGGSPQGERGAAAQGGSRQGSGVRAQGSGEQGGKGAEGQGGKGAGEPEGPEVEGRPLISLCMIVKNEERVLGACLESVRPWVDELIGADTGSTDETMAIAERSGARVVEFPWCDSFAAARNASMQPATGRWILWVDADDTLPFESGRRIREAARNAPENVVGFVVPVQFMEDGSPAGGTRVDHVKLFRNLPGLEWQGRVHEQILPALRAAGKGEIARLDAVVLHSNYDTSPEGQAKKRARNRKLLMLDLQEDPEHPFRRFNLGMEEQYNGEHEAAIEWLRKSLEVSDPEQTHVRKVYARLALSLRELGRQEEFHGTLEEGLRHYPEDPELHFHAGNAAFGRQSYGAAKAHFLKSAGAKIEGHFSSLDMGILGYKCFHNLGNCCLLLDDYSGAKEWWEKSIEAAPQFLPSVFALFDAAMEARDLDTAERMAERVHALEGKDSALGRHDWAKMIERLADAGRGIGSAELVLDQAVRHYPEPAGPRLVLARRLLKVGWEQSATPHLILLAEQDIAEAAYYLGVIAIRSGDLRRGLRWMERAQDLNPEHQPTVEQVANLRQALAA